MTVLLLTLTAIAVTTAVLARRAAARADASERRYRALAAHAPSLAIALVDHKLHFELFEGDALERQGWIPAEIVGRPVADIVPAERMGELGPHLEAALAGRSGRMEWHGLRSDAVFQIDVVPFRSDHDAPISHALLAMRDVTDETRLQRELEEQGGFFSAVLRQLQQRVTVCDADGRLYDFGSAAFDGAADLHPLEWAEHFGLRHPDGRPFGPHEAPLLRALRGEEVSGVEMHVSGPAGEIALVSSGGPVTAPDGRVLGAVIVNADLTAFRDAEGRLRRSEERHRRVVESMTDCVFETDEFGRWTHLSETWTLATGIAVSDSLGRSASEFVHPADRGAHARAFAPLLAGERAALKVSHRFLTASGAERWAEVQVRAISGWDGLPTGFVGVMRDATDERRASQQNQAEQAVMRLLASADGLDDIGPGLIEALASELEWDGAELWRMGADERLHRVSCWTAPGVTLPHFIGAGDGLGYEVGDGLPGLAWMSREPLWKADIRGDEQLVRHVEGVKDGLRSAAALPLRAAGKPVAVLVLVSRTPREPEPGLVRLLDGIGAQVTQFLQRREAETRAAEQAEDLRTLSEVAHELAGHSDMFAARTTLCRAVRDVTRASSVTLWEPAPEQLEVTAAIGAAVRGMTVGLGTRSVTVDAFLSSEVVFVPDLTSDPELAFWHEVAGATSAAWVPVVHDDRCVGVIAVGWATARPELTPRAEELLRLLAAEAAITIHRTDLLARLKSTARTDPLTGLPNRRVWDEDLERELERARRHGGSLCLAMLDLDRFKTYNDRFGHQAGDQLLAQTATAWRPALRTTDTIARYGGEEFAVLLPHSDEEGAFAVVSRLLDVVPLGQTASAGIALWDGVESADELLARADAALYEAKNAGRARALMAP